MRIRIVAVGRLRPGPEATLVADYVKRFDRAGRSLGLGPLEIHEVEAKKSGIEAEGALIDKATSSAEVLVTLDERGKALSSPEFAKALAKWRDDGRRDVCFVIGGADGMTRASM